jgi:hypothetical protein
MGATQAKVKPTMKPKEIFRPTVVPGALHFRFCDRREDITDGGVRPELRRPANRAAMTKYTAPPASFSSKIPAAQQA